MLTVTAADQALSSCSQDAAYSATIMAAQVRKTKPQTDSGKPMMVIGGRALCVSLTGDSPLLRRLAWLRSGAYSVPPSPTTIFTICVDHIHADHQRDGKSIGQRCRRYFGIGWRDQRAENSSPVHKATRAHHEAIQEPGRHKGFFWFAIRSRTSSTSLVPNPSLLTLPRFAQARCATSRGG